MTLVLSGMTGVAGPAVTLVTGELCVLAIDEACAVTDDGKVTVLGLGTPLIRSAFAFFSRSLASVCSRTRSAALADDDAESGTDSLAEASAIGSRAPFESS